MAVDWLFRTQEGICSFRCAGVLIRNGCVLLQREGEEYAVPGGHVRHGETGAEAVVREYAEELGARVSCIRLLWTEECFWEWNGTQTHTLSFYYLLEAEEENLPSDGEFMPQKDHPCVEIGWVPFDRLRELTVYPEFLKDEIYELKPGHFTGGK